MLERLKDLYSAGAVKRWHTHETVGQQTVAEHCWGVMVLLLEIAEEPSAELLTVAMHHDTAELYTGDVPATAKWRSEPLQESIEKMESITECEMDLPRKDMLSREETTLLKVCDMLELCFYCYRQRKLGNLGMSREFVNGANYIKGMDDVPEKALEILDSLTKDCLKL